MKSTAVLKLIESLGVFIDHEVASEEYLRRKGADKIADSCKLRRRICHQIYPKVCTNAVGRLLELINAILESRRISWRAASEIARLVEKTNSMTFVSE